MVVLVNKSNIYLKEPATSAGHNQSYQSFSQSLNVLSQITQK